MWRRQVSTFPLPFLGGNLSRSYFGEAFASSRIIAKRPPPPLPTHIKIEDEPHLLLCSKLPHWVGTILSRDKGVHYMSASGLEQHFTRWHHASLPKTGHIFFENSRGSLIFPTRRAEPFTIRAFELEVSPWTLTAPSLKTDPLSVIDRHILTSSRAWKVRKWGRNGHQI